MKNNKIKIAVFIFIIILTINVGIVCKKSYAADGIKSFNNAPRVHTIRDEEKFADVIVRVRDYNGVDEKNIHLYLNDEDGSELTTKNGLVRIEESQPNVEYYYVLSQEYLAKWLKGKTSQRFYIEVEDNSGNYTKTYFKITTNGKRYGADASPRIVKWSGKGDQISFVARDKKGIELLRLYDVNDGSKKVIEMKDLNNVENTVEFDIKKFKAVNGIYKIKIYARDKHGVDAYRQVALKVGDFEPQSIKIENDEINIAKGYTADLTTTISPSYANKHTNLTYISSNNNIATVNPKGKITGVELGTAEITATTGNGVSAKCKVTVTEEIKVTDVKFKDEEILIYKGGTETLKTEVNPANATNREIKFSSENEQIATVDKTGKVTGVGVGNTVITAESNNGKTAKCKVTVEELKEGMEEFYDAPTFKGKIVKGKFADVTINITDINGIKKENIHIYVNNKNGKELKVGNGLTEIVEAKTKDGNVIEYNYVISDKYLNRQNKKFYMSAKDNKGNILYMYFIVKCKKDGGYTVDAAPRVSEWNAKGKDITFKVKDLAGISKLQIYDLNGNSKVAKQTIDKSKLKIDSKGYATITIDALNFKAVNGEYRLNVYAADLGGLTSSTRVRLKIRQIEATDIKFVDKEIIILQGSTMDVSTKSDPTYATNLAKYTIDDTSKVKIVSSTPRKVTIKGLALGTTHLKVTTDNNKTANIKINVVSAKYNINKMKLKVKQKKKISPPVVKSNVSYTIEYKSSNKKVATIDSKGNITAKSGGKTIIKAYIKGKDAKSNAYAQFTLNVMNNVSSSTKPVAARGDGYTRTITLNGRKFRLWKQTSGSYSGHIYRNGWTYNRSGCGPTAMTIIASGYGFKGNPEDFANKMPRKGDSSTLDDTLRKLGLNAVSYSKLNNKTISKDLKTAFEKGHEIAFEFQRWEMNGNIWRDFSGSGNHWVAALGYDPTTQKVFIANPNGAKAEKWITFSQLVTLIDTKPHYIEVWKN